MTRLIGTALLLAAASNLHAQDIGEVEFRFGVRIPTRDGTELNATLYLPAAGTPQPVVLTLTPYLADTYHRWAMHLAQRGYVFAAVDVRGRGNSGGSFEPMVNDARDGFDVVQWLATQPWSNGKVAMWEDRTEDSPSGPRSRNIPRRLAPSFQSHPRTPGSTFRFFTTSPRPTLSNG